MENAELDKILEDIRAQLPPPRTDGSRRKIMFTKREEALIQTVKALMEHVQVYNGAREMSTAICAGCTHDRMRVCPLATAFTVLHELGVTVD